MIGVGAGKFLLRQHAFEVALIEGSVVVLIERIETGRRGQVDLVGVEGTVVVRILFADHRLR
jgi:hypothetical protein